ncbi:MAG: hypothetical protein JST93_01700 [Acidobacteria bacterium]|nr:hypothetical protein [Acidobacteriota bacterium]
MIPRRHFLASSAALSLQAQPAPKKVAAIVTMYTNDGRLNTHANVIIGRLLDGYSPNGVFTKPRTRIVSMFTDQTPPADLSRGLAAKHGFQICNTIRDALTLNGSDLAVDAVCFVGEHGNYPTNDRGQKLYPRYELMERIVEAFRRTGKSVPVFHDKHFSYSWQKAKAMYGWSRELRFPLMAGSSIPLTVRTPQLEIPYGAAVEHALMIGYGDMDAYGFHTLESLQCMIERRKGGETGIRAVEWLDGDAVWKWRDSAGQWSRPLLDAAFARAPQIKAGRPEDNVKTPAAFLLEYRDGLKAVAYMLNGHASGWTFAAKLQGKADPVATHFGQPRESGAVRPLAHFDGLVHCMEEMFVTGQPLYPVERTLLTTCALSLLFESRAWKKRLETPELAIAYRAPREAYYQKT